MDFKYYDYYEGMDPGLEVSSYDGAEYELYSFGERIGQDDNLDETEAAQGYESTEAEKSKRAASSVEEGFGETIKPENKENLSDQIDDDKLHQAAKSDYQSGEHNQP